MWNVHNTTAHYATSPENNLFSSIIFFNCTFWFKNHALSSLSSRKGPQSLQHRFNTQISLRTITLFRSRTMLLYSTFLAGAACVTTVLAQAHIAFTSVPAVVVAGHPYNITWSGGDGVSVKDPSIFPRFARLPNLLAQTK